MKESYKEYASHKERLSPEKFLSLSSHERLKIKSVKIIPPSLFGENNWGYIEVKHSSQKYKTNF